MRVNKFSQYVSKNFISNAVFPAGAFIFTLKTGRNRNPGRFTPIVLSKGAK